MQIVSFFKKLFIGINVLVAASLLLACLVPYISLETLPFVAFLSLGIPILVFVNLLFLLFWAFSGKKQLFLSLIVLIISYFSLSSFFMFRFTSDDADSKADLKVMTYNVRGFNRYKNIDAPNVFDEILDLINTENPDVICFQEFDDNKQKAFKNYKYKYLKYIDNKGKVTLAVYSKFPIINEGLINFPESPNNASFVDIRVKKDTIRVYNLHLESLRVIPDKDVIAKEESKKLYKRVTHSFKKQQEQAEIIKENLQNTSYKAIVCGDFNGTQYSNVYRTIRSDLQDSFQEKGSGYGRTYNFKYYPVRIDFILVDKSFEVVSHQNYDAKLSDHFPVMTSINLQSH
ncbi:endonuclease/exonuclease/phosphatase family protein [Cellulophaga tyrosinoxydans]|uniref:Metal-dependent hydrolase, endonuclease/exonuclease/phosphatase family n=1 Tax=Cellulophaga tyrosinoxydans TaxID=504486 RepID=A0A1W2CH32_9FLAO|nr:endonuclease/exonuclease/phosphatase family protein [Cellulophaga tyrosinoxydans]SMC84565.1 Metal-dependent hydrolase, endonuclease/exonuclease/phosphatase family [Cellulophaga tyrosinoxydans]